MKLLTMILFIGLGFNAMGAFQPCDNTSANYKAKQAKKTIAKKFKGKRKWTSAKTGTCSLGWAEKILGKKRPNVSFSIRCGVVYSFKNKTDMNSFAQEIHDQRLSHITYSDLFADVTIPVCGQF